MKFSIAVVLLALALAVVLIGAQVRKQIKRMRTLDIAGQILVTLEDSSIGIFGDD